MLGSSSPGPSCCPYSAYCLEEKFSEGRKEGSSRKMGHLAHRHAVRSPRY
jgi:hypothetical protein